MRISRAGTRILSTAALAVAALVLSTLPAAAHDGDDWTTPDEHARQDLIGTPMSVIEAETAANAKKPAATKARLTAPQTTFTNNGGTNTTGSWSSVYNTPVVPVFQALLPSGKVLMWDSTADVDPTQTNLQGYTRAAVWNPTTNTYKSVNLTGANIFAAGFSQLGDGNVLVAGGNADPELNGIRETHLFDWKTETWRRGPDMSAERWYAGVTALSDGEALIFGGGQGQAEVYQNNGALRELNGFYFFPYRAYPYLSVRPDSRVEFVGPGPGTATMKTSGSGALDVVKDRDGIFRTYASFASFAPGKTLVSGGGDLTEGGQTRVPTKTAVVVDASGTGTSVQATGSMNFPRRQHNLTVLSDGSVLATGGESKADNEYVDLANPVKNAERWDPATGRWTTLAAANRVRQYHSTALLLPDGRVMTAGGGVCGLCVQAGYLEKNVEYFTPPSLLNSSGGALSRPVLSNVPGEMRIGSSIDTFALLPLNIAKIGLVRLGAPTHSADQGQRYVPLSFTKSLLGLHINAPASGSIAPPGYYMMFAVDSAGVSSVASMIKVVGPASSTSGRVVQAAGGCLDGADNAAVTLRYCAGAGSGQAVGQQWDRKDLTLQTRGKCLNLQSGLLGIFKTVRLDSCTGATSQRWIRYTDKTIRPQNDAAACLRPDALRDGAQIVLAACDGSSLNSWN